MARSSLHAFRLRFIQEYLYYDSHSYFRAAHLFLEELIILDILKQLFLIMPVKYDVSNVPSCYQSLMNTWSLFPPQKVTSPNPVDGIPLNRCGIIVMLITIVIL